MATTSESTLRQRLIIFDADTCAGRDFDLALIVFTRLSIVLVLLDCIPRMAVPYTP